MTAARLKKGTAQRFIPTIIQRAFLSNTTGSTLYILTQLHVHYNSLVGAVLNIRTLYTSVL